MVNPQTYILPPNRLVPNSPYPLVHYPGLLAEKAENQAAAIHDLFSSNGWETQWIYRYGPTQPAHYHSATHECMAVLTGTATIRFGIADADAESKADTDDSAPDGQTAHHGVEVQANPGDVFIIPAGVSHKTFNTPSGSTFELLTPGDGHSIDSHDVRQALMDVQLSGFTMMGAYPSGGAWDFSKGGEHVGAFPRVWAVEKPPRDPVLGDARSGLCGLWH